jgi:hypothetical protein
MKFRFPIPSMPSLMLLAAAAGAGVAADPPRTNEVQVTVDGMKTVGNLPLLPGQEFRSGIGDD